MVQLNKGYRTSLVLALLGFICATRWLLHTPEAPSAWIHYCACGFVGIVTAFVYAQLRPYFTAPQPPRAKDDTTHTHAHAHAHTAARTPLHVAHAPQHTHRLRLLATARRYIKNSEYFTDYAHPPVRVLVLQCVLEPIEYPEYP